MSTVVHLQPPPSVIGDTRSDRHEKSLMFWPRLPSHRSTTGIQYTWAQKTKLRELSPDMIHQGPLFSQLRPSIGQRIVAIVQELQAHPFRLRNRFCGTSVPSTRISLGAF